MKTITLLSLFFIIAGTTKAQIDKGQFLLGGSISFQSIKNEVSGNPHYRTTNFFVSPNIGYFILPKFAAGLRADLASYQQKAPYAGNTQRNTSLSPFVRYYILPAKGKMNIFLDAAYIHSKSRFSNPQSPTAYIEKANGYSIAAGSAIFLSKNIALEFSIGYRHTQSVAPDDSKFSTVNSGIGLQIHLDKFKRNKKKQK